MKIIKKILLLFIVIVLTGCSVNYDLTINQDLSINEEVTAQEETSTLRINTGLDEEQSVNYLYNIFKRDSVDSKINTITEGRYTISTVTANYDTIEEYLDNFSSEIFEASDIVKKGDRVTLLFKQKLEINPDALNRVIYDDITVKISVPFEVIKNNADSKDGNTYIWKIDDESGLKDISITYDVSKTKDKVNFKLFDISFKISYQVIAISVIVIIILAITIIVYINNKKNNRI